MWCVNSIKNISGNANQDYTFYDSKHRMLAKFSKALMCRLSKVIAKSADFRDRSEFRITLSDKLMSSNPQLLPDSWALFSKYLKAHHKEYESLKYLGSVNKSLLAIKSASEIVLLDLLYFSSRY